MVDERRDETWRRQEGIALQVDDQVDRPEAAGGLGAALGAVAARIRGHDHRGPEAIGDSPDALIIGDDMDGLNAGHPRRRLVAALDQRLRRPAGTLQLDQWLAGIAGRGEPRRNQDDGLHRAAGQS